MLCFCFCLLHGELLIFCSWVRRGGIQCTLHQSRPNAVKGLRTCVHACRSQQWEDPLSLSLVLRLSPSDRDPRESASQHTSPRVIAPGHLITPPIFGFCCHIFGVSRSSRATFQRISAYSATQVTQQGETRKALQVS